VSMFCSASNQCEIVCLPRTAPNLNASFEQIYVKGLSRQFKT